MVSLPVSESAERTEPGNYFVANYPPFSAWRADDVPAVLAALDSPAAERDLAAGAPLGLYLHIPFCRKRCKFCYFRVYTDKNSDEVETYLDSLSREIELYAQRPALAGRQFEFVYFGGGTPSFLSAGQLARLVERINRHWRWDAAREVTFECEPGTLQRHKLETIRAIGATRLSLGIEHFDDAVLELGGRAHRSAEVYRAYEWARAVGFPQINIDLIAGMVGDTPDKWDRTIAEALRLEPDSVTIYQMELPHNTVIVRESRASGRPPAVADWATKRAQVRRAFERFEAAGYAVSSAYTLVRAADADGNADAASGARQPARFVYRDALWHGADMIGTGVASFSHFAGVHYQNADAWEDYVGAVQRGALPIARALATTPRARLIRELILQLKLGRLDRGYFRGKFETDVVQAFCEPFDGLVREGLAQVGDDAVTLTRGGLLCVDALLPRFFEPQYRNVRYT